MMDIHSAQLAYFSGTGGTARVAEHFENAFSKHGIHVSKTELHARAPKENEADLLVILFPVYACTAPGPVIKWIAGTEPGNGRPAAVISISGGGNMSPNTACRTHVIKQLENKGYFVCYEGMIVMPGNVLVPFGDVLSAMILRAAPAKSERAVDEILSGRTRRTSSFLFDKIIARLGALGERYTGVFGRHLKPSDRCVGCGWCAGNCPRGNIVMREGKPTFGSDCVICLGCVYGCPKKAIVPGVGKFFILKGGYDLDALERRTEQMSEFPPAKQIAKGYFFKGVREYLEDNE